MNFEKYIWKDVKDIANALIIGVVFLYGSSLKPTLPLWVTKLFKNFIVKILFFVVILLVAKIDVMTAVSTSLIFFTIMTIMQEMETKEKIDNIENFVNKKRKL